MSTDAFWDTEHTDLKSIFYDTGAITDVGNTRKINQDNILCVQKNRYALMAVADGMGGMESGELVSNMAAQALHRWWEKNINGGGLVSFKETEKSLSNEISNINSKVVSYCTDKGVKAGTTLTVALLNGERCFFAYSGDTRLYIIRDKTVEQLTQDENLYSYLKEMNEPDNPPKNKSILLSYIGKSENFPLNFNSIEVKRGDIFVICSDGLYNYFDFYENYDIIRKTDAQTAADNIRSIVKEQRASDNLSLVIVKYK